MSLTSVNRSLLQPFLTRSHYGKHFKCSCHHHRQITTTGQVKKSQESTAKQQQASVDLSKYPPESIRNFGIIAHVDHGKSTLSDRLLQMTGTIPPDVDVKQYLDKLQVEKERGITVKAQSVAMFYDHKASGKSYLLNLIDTPGHVDFSYEVWRTLPACQGALLLIDANSGIQAQTVAHFNHAILHDLPIIPVINKIDMKNANPPLVLEQLNRLFSVDPKDVIQVSARYGTNIELIFDAIIQRIPSPKVDLNKAFRGLLFDSWHDKYKGVVILVSVLDGCIKTGDEITSLKTGTSYVVNSVGIISPDEVNTGILYAGHVGYFTANIRDTNDARVGDIFVQKSSYAEILKSGSSSTTIIPEPKSMVFAGIFPSDQMETLELKKALQKITLTDPSVQIKPDSSPALGNGFRLGFLGLLHMEVFNQRLEQEYDAETVITAPSVPYKIKIRGEKNIKLYGSDVITITNPLKLPDINIIEEYYEPIVTSTIITPDEYLSPITSLIMERRGEQLSSSYIDQNRLIISVKFPLSEVIVDFYDVLKTMTSGYASFDYEDSGYVEAPLVRVDILINDVLVEELVMITHVKRAKSLGSDIVRKLSQTLPQQQYAIKIQAAVGKKFIARENIRSLRKDVTAKLYGGDKTRRDKLLARQKEGKERMRQLGNIQIPRDCFIQILKKK